MFDQIKGGLSFIELSSRRGVLLRSVPRTVRGRYLFKVTFGANGFYFTTSSYLMWWKKGWPPKFLGVFEEKSMLIFFSVTH